MRKTLTVSIAAYNVEKYISKTLESLSCSKHLDKMEIFIVDDGGNDSTMLIADKYQKKYPASFISVRKENGGYGSTINYTIKKATGKYYKVLDGDDWFDTEGLDVLLDELEHADEDVIVTNYYRWIEDVGCRVNYAHNENNGVVMDIATLGNKNYKFGMWELVFKTDLLRTSELVLPIHTLYTDRHYSTIPFAYANSIKFLDTKVYCYRLGRDEQSVSPDSQVRHYKERVQGSFDLCTFYRDEKSKGNPRCAYLKKKISASHVQTASVVRYMPKSIDSLKMLKEYEKKIGKISDEIVKDEWKHGQFGLFLTLCRLTNYLFYWITPDKVLKKT